MGRKKCSEVLVECLKKEYYMTLQVIIQILFLTWLAKASPPSPPLARPNCQAFCGKIAIPFPFGMGLGCYSHKRYEIVCDNTSIPAKPYIRRFKLEVLNFSLPGNIVSVSFPIMSSGCDDVAATGRLKVSLEASPYAFSHRTNMFVAMGCDNLALLKDGDAIIGGCLSLCEQGLDSTNRVRSDCVGINCCQTTIPSGLRVFNPSTESLNGSKDVKGGCKKTFLVDQQWFTSLKNLQDVHAIGYVPVVLDWWIDRSTFNFSEINNSRGFQCLLPAGISAGHRLSIVQCHCLPEFTGNPYLPHGCQGVDPFLNPDAHRQYPHSVCRSFDGGYSCFPPGTVPVQDYKAQLKLVLLLSGVAIGIGILFFLMGLWKIHHEQKKSKEIELKKHFFERNGGLLLQQQLASGEANINRVSLFSSPELAKATDNFSVNRILGRGGQGTVYKGMLEDGRIVAVKRSGLVSEGKVESFINEVVILSQINHRNVVKLLGCCLETEVPLLVYEFIPNGTVSDYLHCPNDHGFLLTWEMRVRIAAEVAGALSYLHSAASFPIYHRDIKTSNILLDDLYRAKLADFGISRTVAMGKTHLTTQVQGTFGYLDPEYFQTSQCTEKSDVYSFGVVLVELLTGRDSSNCGEEVSLVKCFMISMEENRLEDIVDTQLKKQAGKAAVTAVAQLAERCLNMNGQLRPTMKEATHELEKFSSTSSVPFCT